MVACDGDSSGQMGSLRLWGCRQGTGDSMGVRAELRWQGIRSYLEVVSGAHGGRHTQCRSRVHAWCLGEKQKQAWPRFV